VTSRNVKEVKIVIVIN